MRKILNIIAILVIVSAYPLLRFVAQNFVLESNKEIYEYIPESSDVIIELNTRNFIEEVAYQRVFNESYFNEKIFPEDEELPIEFREIGINLFTSVIVFREQWADENIWMCLMEYNSKKDFVGFMSEELPEANLFFGEQFVIIQLTPSIYEAAVNKHIEKIMNGEIKSIHPKVNLTEKFDPNKEINCYFEPGLINADNQLINGFLNFDFVADKIKVDGSFTPITGFEDNPGIAYEIDENAAFSMRSSLNIFNSIYWFGKETIDNVPEYSQMAMDYDGMNVFVVDPVYNNDFPFKFFPEFQVHFDLYDPVMWQEFFTTLSTEGKVRIDTTTQQIVTEQGAYFQYNLNEREFELMRSTVKLTKTEDYNTYFSLVMNIDKLIGNTKKAVDEKNPPNGIMLTILNAGIEEMIEELQIMTNIDKIHFKMSSLSEEEIIAHGGIEMKYIEGHSMIETLSFGRASLIFIKDYFLEIEEE